MFQLSWTSLSHDAAKRHLVWVCAVVVTLSVCFVSYQLFFKPDSEFAIRVDTNPVSTLELNTSGSNTQHLSSPRQLRPPPPAGISGNEHLSLDAFRSMLLAHEYESVVDAYDQIYTNSATELSTSYRELLVDHASDLIQDNSPARAIALLNHYLTIFYVDVDALILLGRAYRDSGLKFDAIKALQSAYQHEHRTAVSGLILGQENTLIGEYVQELKENNDQQGLVEFYQWLTQSQPNVSGYYIGLAGAYTAQGRHDEAMQTLRYVQHDIKVGPQARSLMQELKKQ